MFRFQILALVLVLGLPVSAQTAEEGPRKIVMKVEVIPTTARMSGVRVHLDRESGEILVLGPALNKVEEQKFKGFEFPAFLQRSSLKAPGDFELVELDGEAAQPGGRSYGNLVHDPAAKKLHYFGGFVPNLVDEHGCFDLEARSWTKITPKEGPAPGPRDAAASFLAADGKSFFLSGGLRSKGPMDELWRYEFETSAWSQVEKKEGASWPSPRLTAPGCLLPDGRGVVIGGLDINFGALQDVWAFDSQKLVWERLADLPEGLSGVAAVWHPKLKRLLAIGGSRAAAAQSSVYAYDPEKNAWEKLGELQTAVAHASAVYDEKGDRVLVIGGTVGMFLAPHPETMIQVLSFR